jgi:predicted aspartyl protease
MKYSYTESFSPPAPILPVEIFIPDEPQQRVQVDAKLDTAADISAIPFSVVNEWGLEPVSEVLVAGYSAETAVLSTYAVALELPEARIRSIEVVVVPDSCALLGRDVLNHFSINLNGPDLIFEITIHHKGR